MPNRYASLDQVKQDIGTDAASTATLQYLWQALEFVSVRIERETGWEFAPRVETRYFDARGEHLLTANRLDVAAGQLSEVKSPLLSVTSVTLGGDTAALDAGAYREHPRGVTPIQMLDLIDGNVWTQFGDTVQGAHAIAGIWGYRSRFADAFKLVDSLTANIANATVQTFTVSDADAVAGYGLPRFSPGMLLRIGTGSTFEYRYVYSVNNSTNTISATRGDNGSTAQSFTQDTGVYVFQPEPAIQRAALRWAAYLHARAAKFGSVTYDGVTTETFPPDMPQEVANILENGGYLNRGMFWGAI